MSAGKTAWDEIPFEDRAAALRAAIRIFDGAGHYARTVADGKRPDGPPGVWIWGEPPQGWRDILEGADALRVRELAGNPFELQTGDGEPSATSPRRPLALDTCTLYLDLLREVMEDAEAAGKAIPAEVCRRAGALAGECRFGYGQAVAELRAEFELEGATLAAVRRVAEARAAMFAALDNAEAAEAEKKTAEEAARRERESRIDAEAVARTLEGLVHGGLAEVRGGVARLEEAAQDAFRRGENERERALTVPVEMAAEILKLAQREMGAEGAALWVAYRDNGFSINAAAKALGKPYVNMNRLFHATVEPFMVKHGLTFQAEGRHKVLAYNGKTDAHLSRPSGYHGPHKLDDGEDGGD